MKTIILAGGLGTRLSEETVQKPKPMVEIGPEPILWHIMNIYSHYGFKEFVLALGYKGEIIKNYFINYRQHKSDLSIDLNTGKVTAGDNSVKDWTVDLINTGQNTLTGGRLLRLADMLKTETFMLTYGDGIADIDVGKLLQFHKSHKKIATVTAVRPVARFGGMAFDGDKVIEFKEKPQTGEGWINGGFFVFNPGIFDYLKQGDETVLEGDPLENLVKDNQLMAYKHEGFWQCMDTLRDKQHLDSMWVSGKAPWKVWKEQA
jgi:glucose-1-phosphate cytidylyltransferase